MREPPNPHHRTPQSASHAPLSYDRPTLPPRPLLTAPPHPVISNGAGRLFSSAFRAVKSLFSSVVVPGSVNLFLFYPLLACLPKAHILASSALPSHHLPEKESPHLCATNTATTL